MHRKLLIGYRLRKVPFRRAERAGPASGRRPRPDMRILAIGIPIHNIFDTQCGDPLPWVIMVLRIP